MRPLLTFAKPSVKGSSTTPRICIIGAGVSGLRCADILLQRGFNVTILEARDRIGGRLYQTTLPSGQLVDIGPNWIHGSENSPILDLANETKSVPHIWEGGFNIFDEAGRFVENGNELSGKMWEIVIQAFEYSTKNTSTIDPGESLYDFFVERVKEMFPDATKQEEQRKIVLHISEMWGAIVGSPVKKQSLKFFWLEECVDGGTLFSLFTSKDEDPLVTRVTRSEAQYFNTSATAIGLCISLLLSLIVHQLTTTREHILRRYLLEDPGAYR